MVQYRTPDTRSDNVIDRRREGGARRAMAAADPRRQPRRGRPKGVVVSSARPPKWDSPRQFDKVLKEARNG